MGGNRREEPYETGRCQIWWYVPFLLCDNRFFRIHICYSLFNVPLQLVQNVHPVIWYQITVTPLHHWVNNHHYNIMHRRNEDSPVTERFTGDMDTLKRTCMILRWLISCIAVTHVSAKYGRAGGSGFWGHHILWEWTSESIHCEACSMTIC